MNQRMICLVVCRAADWTPLRWRGDCLMSCDDQRSHRCPVGFKPKLAAFPACYIKHIEINKRHSSGSIKQIQTGDTDTVAKEFLSLRCLFSFGLYDTPTQSNAYNMEGTI